MSWYAEFGYAAALAALLAAERLFAVAQVAEHPVCWPAPEYLVACCLVAAERFFAVAPVVERLVCWQVLHC